MKSDELGIDSGLGHLLAAWILENYLAFQFFSSSVKCEQLSPLGEMVLVTWCHVYEMSRTPHIEAII